ncbi:MAG TPA: BamA/TamA family outer membrane protein [Gemmatimonadaceae bacterium]|nr:BamA/TamA family outer membrane protein [Gemmatimonadaceae bacterium]
MKRLLLIAALLGPVPVLAQRVRPQAVPEEVGRAITSLYNAPDTRRVRGEFELARDSTIQGSLAVRVGPARIGGHITGSLVIINADVTFLPGARIDGQVYVVGGTATGRSDATIGSDFRAYAETLRYRLEDDQLVVEEDDSRAAVRRHTDDDFWRRDRDYTTSVDFFAVSGSNAYNRVEGYPIRLGPRIRVRREWGTFSLSARAIVRTAEPIDWGRGTLGHDVRAELRRGPRRGLGVGVNAFDRVDPVESWHLSDNEAALAAAVIHRDYRDYYGRHGGRVFLSMYPFEWAAITAGYGAERWESRAVRDPWTLFRGDETWRPNPAVDDGRAHMFNGTLQIDTRNERYSPGNGWYVRGDIEHTTFDPDVPHSLIPVDGPIPVQRTYTRGFVDARRYNRLAPWAQFNFRVVLGGWMNGDALPLQKRLSVGGPGTLPGFDFRTTSGSGVDRLQCSEGTGPASDVPVLCDRVALFQMEYRGDLSWHSGRGRDRRWLPSDLDLPTWMVFADAGRGWRAHADGGSSYPVESFPALSTFKTDIGAGLDFGALSFSLAKSMSDREEPMNFIVRLSRRF